jgi:uncharacterized protein (TIGR00251 family)
VKAADATPRPWRPVPNGVRLELRVTPNAGRDAIEGVEIRDDGSPVLRCRVKAVPDKGKANTALIALLAKALGLPKSDLTLVSGDTARQKSIEIAGEPRDLMPKLETISRP